eukprot:1747100-Rhodomonas_salina.1
MEWANTPLDWRRLNAGPLPIRKKKKLGVRVRCDLAARAHAEGVDRATLGALGGTRPLHAGLRCARGCCSIPQVGVCAAQYQDWGCAHGCRSVPARASCVRMGALQYQERVCAQGCILGPTRPRKAVLLWYDAKTRGTLSLSLEKHCTATTTDICGALRDPRLWCYA